MPYRQARNVTRKIAGAAIPTAFAATLVGVPAAVLTAVAESALILLGGHYFGLGYAPATVPAALVTIWAIFGATVATSYGVRRQVA